jgi:hypothetical protein
LYEVFGGEVDYWHEVRGAFAFTNELFTPFNYFRNAEQHGFFGSDEVQQLFNKYLLFDQGFAPWKEFDHPQYGKIEIGGPTKNWVRQPPSFLLEEECHRNMAFSLYCADNLARVSVQKIDVKELGGDLFEVTAIVENDRICPTHSAADLKNKLTPPDLVTLSGQDLKVIVGLVSREPFFREPREQKREPAKMKLNNISGQEVVYVRWIVEGKGSYAVEVKSVKGGSHLLKQD